MATERARERAGELLQPGFAGENPIVLRPEGAPKWAASESASSHVNPADGRPRGAPTAASSQRLLPPRLAADALGQPLERPSLALALTLSRTARAEGAPFFRRQRASICSRATRKGAPALGSFSSAAAAAGWRATLWTIKEAGEGQLCWLARNTRFAGAHCASRWLPSWLLASR